MPASVWSSLPRALPHVVTTGVKSSSDAGKGETGVRTRKTGERRPELPGVVAPLPYGKSNRKVFTCFRCCVEFDALWKLVRHKKSHAEDEKATVSDEEETSLRVRGRPIDGKADGRNESASAAEELSEELSKSAGTKPERKLQCGGGVREGSAVRGDARKDERKRYHNCPHCEYQSAYSSHLKRHVRALHSGERPHPCPHCHYRATQASHLKSHLEAVHLGQRTHHCPHCDYRSAQSSNLRKHVSATHLGEKSHPCPHCDHRATSSSDLKSHVSAVHLGQRPFGCPHCDYRAARSSDLKSHVRRIHGQQP